MQSQANKLRTFLDLDIFALDEEEREEVYRELRDVMHKHYQCVSGNAVRKRRRYITMRRSQKKTVAGREFPIQRHAVKADYEESSLEEDKDVYFGEGGAQMLKYALAILTGRYDGRLPSSETGHEKVDKATKIRREEHA